MFVTTKGLVLRQVRYKEADRIMTLLTADRGKITVKARGALRKGSRMAAASQALCYSEFTLFANKGRWTADESSSIEQFLGLREDISQLALGAYFAELLDTVCPEEMTADGALSLALNALYALSRGIYDPAHIKSVFELRLMSLEGFEPEVEACGVCGRADIREPRFSPDAGMVHCRDCAAAVTGGSLALDEEALTAMRHVIRAVPKREFSFVIPEQSETLLGQACELFVRRQLDKSLPSLEYWKSVK